MPCCEVYANLGGIFQLRIYSISYKNILEVPWFLTSTCYFYCPPTHLLCPHAINNYVKTILYPKLPSVSKHSNPSLSSLDWSTVVTSYLISLPSFLSVLPLAVFTEPLKYGLDYVIFILRRFQCLSVTPCKS